MLVTIEMSNGISTVAHLHLLAYPSHRSSRAWSDPPRQTPASSRLSHNPSREWNPWSPSQTWSIYDELLQANTETDNLDAKTGMSAHGQGEVTTIDTSTESDLRQPELHRLRHRNFFASPLLRLPTELILEIFDRAIQPNDEIGRAHV